MSAAEKKNVLREKVLSWYAEYGRAFSWRKKSPEPYLTLVSETMLQQTQTSRVEDKLPQFLTLYPDFASLAQAPNADIIRAWQGMGYNSRALRLRDCARTIVQDYGGKVPDSYEILRKLPGVGDYTARALMAFAFHRDVAVVDVNIRRVYSRIFSPMATTADTLPETETKAIAEEIFPRGESSAWHQAIMDLGAMICTARAPKCLVCPAQDICESAFAMKEKSAEKKPEPSHRGVPNRIWRGRAVEILRKEEDIPAAELLAGVLKTEPAEEDFPWFENILRGLEKDRLVTIVSEERGAYIRLAE